MSEKSINPLNQWLRDYVAMMEANLGVLQSSRIEGLYEGIVERILDVRQYLKHASDERLTCSCEHGPNGPPLLRRTLQPWEHEFSCQHYRGRSSDETRETAATALLCRHWEKLGAELPDVYEYLRLVTVSEGHPFEWPGMRLSQSIGDKP